ncbi:hypothetical protein [Parasphingorhabdus sp.]|uniref:hypothetical protein n=1 Tax=Parasphingorhabdus sp. TaxID=2709688 RepID=UPI003D2E6F1F
MSDVNQSQAAKAPIHTVRDGAVNLKIWENLSSEGRAFYNITIARTYTDKATGDIRETKSLRPNDLDKLFYLGVEAKRMIGMLNERNQEIDRSQIQGSQEQASANIQTQAGEQEQSPPTQTPQTASEQGAGLAAQRDAALAGKAKPQNSNNIATSEQQPTQEP